MQRNFPGLKGNEMLGDRACADHKTNWEFHSGGTSANQRAESLKHPRPTKISSEDLLGQTTLLVLQPFSSTKIEVWLYPGRSLTLTRQCFKTRFPPADTPSPLCFRVGSYTELFCPWLLFTVITEILSPAPSSTLWWCYLKLQSDIRLSQGCCICIYSFGK